MQNGDQAGPVETKVLGIGRIWNVVRTFLQVEDAWKTVSPEDKDKWFVKTRDFITVSCDATERNVIECKILPSTVEFIADPFFASIQYPMNRNARVRFSKSGGAITDYEFTDASSLGKLLQTKLLPFARPAAQVPVVRVIEKIDLPASCETQDDILDFMAYYQLYPMTNANEEIFFSVGDYPSQYRVYVVPKLKIRLVQISAQVTTHKDPMAPFEHKFSTGQGLIDALRAVGITVNTDVDISRTVRRPSSGLRSVLKRFDHYIDIIFNEYNTRCE
jgi:hypothetical protein